MKVYTGTSGYGYKEWKGKFYPEKLAAGKMLAFYAGKLPAVEINNTFYRMPQYSVLEAWAEQVPREFSFAVKAPQVITHIKRLHKVREETRFLMTSLKGLGAKLGAVLFQFPASFHQDLPRLEEFLGLIPRKIPCAFDFRSASWLNQETAALLKERGFCLCLEDTDEKPAGEPIPAAPWGYLRLRREAYTAADLERWAEMIRGQNWEKAFVFFKHDNDTAAKAPALAASFAGLAGRSVSAGRAG